MSKIYAIVEDGDERILVRIQCDSCDAVIYPNKDIKEFGWIKKGWDNGSGTEKIECYFCPKHS